MFIDEHRDRFGVEPICGTLDVSASAYYQRASGERCARMVEDERLTVRIREVHQANYECYGYRRTRAALVGEGETAGRDQVARLMASSGIQGAKRRGKPWQSTDPEAQRASDLVKRDFTAQAADRLWVTDFTYLSSWKARAFFSFVIDVFSRMIVGWQLACHMRTDLVLDALRMALGLRARGADVALVAHGDAGSHYTSHDCRQQLSDQHVLASIGTIGECYDNALAESFLDSFKTELIADRVRRTRARLELAVVQYVAWFNHIRLHSSLGNRPPAEHQHDWRTAHDARETIVDINGRSISPVAAVDITRDSSSSGGELMGSGGRAVDFRGAGRRRRGAAPVRLRGRAGVMKLRFGEGRRRAVGRLVVMMSGGALLCESPRPAPDSEGRSRVERHGGRG